MGHEGHHDDLHKKVLKLKSVAGYKPRHSYKICIAKPASYRPNNFFLRRAALGCSR